MIYYAILLVFSLIMLGLTSAIMAKLNNQSNFPPKDDSHIGTMKTADYAGIIFSLGLVLWCGWKIYGQYRKS